SLNSGLPENRPAYDGTYRGIVKTVPPDKVVAISLAPAQVFEGTVLLGDTGKPAANARIVIWAREENSGSMASSEGKTDTQGRFRLIPYAGVAFGIEAYPPRGEPYFARRVDGLKSTVDHRPNSVEIRLPVAVLARGTVVDARTAAPVARA